MRPLCVCVFGIESVVKMSKSRINAGISSELNSFVAIIYTRAINQCKRLLLTLSVTNHGLLYCYYTHTDTHTYILLLCFFLYCLIWRFA